MQRKILRERAEEAIRETPELSVLQGRLLGIGGEAVVWPMMIEEDLEKILKRGFIQHGKHINFMPGETSRCHANVADLWRQNGGRLKIVTGYAMSDDDLWRQHSWLIDMEDRVPGGHNLFRIVETTTPRELYYGFVLWQEEAEEFEYNNG